MNKIIIGIVSSLITVYVTWLSYTVYDLSKTTVLIDYKMNRVNEVLQMFSEEINFNREHLDQKYHHKIINYSKNPINPINEIKEDDNNLVKDSRLF